MSLESRKGMEMENNILENDYLSGDGAKKRQSLFNYI